MMKNTIHETAIKTFRGLPPDIQNKASEVLAGMGTPTLRGSGALYALKYAFPLSSSSGPLVYASVSAMASGRVGLLRKPAATLIVQVNKCEITETLPASLVFVTSILAEPSDEELLADAANIARAFINLLLTDSDSSLQSSENRQVLRDLLMGMSDIKAVRRISGQQLEDPSSISPVVKRYLGLLSGISGALLDRFPDIDTYPSHSSGGALDDPSESIDPRDEIETVSGFRQAAFRPEVVAGNDGQRDVMWGRSDTWEHLHEGVTVWDRRIAAHPVRQNLGDFSDEQNEALALLSPEEAAQDAAVHLARSEFLKSLVLAISPSELENLSFSDLGIDLRAAEWRRFAPTRPDSFSRGVNLTPLHPETSDWVTLGLPTILKENLKQLARLGLITQDYSFSEFCRSIETTPAALLKDQMTGIQQRYYMPVLGLDQFREQIPLFATAMNWSLCEVYWCTCRPNHRPPVGDHYEQRDDLTLSEKFEQLIRWYFEGRS